jgi:hypothetical protein
MTEYVTKAEFTAQKARLTRALHSDNPVAVLDAVEKTLAEWRGKAWPDDWARWLRSLEDAWYKFASSDAYDDDQDINDSKISRRFVEAIRRMR